MSFTYRLTCNECCAVLEPHEQYVCPHCDSESIDKEPVAARVDFDDVADAKRLQAIREYWNKQYAAMDFLAVAADITTADTGSVPAINFLTRQAS